MMEAKSNSRELNEEQKKAAFCTQNAVVTAGAGSGKTRVLANRFAQLLTENGFKADEILTLTFTKKAAVEMNKRIYSLLCVIADNETGIKAKRAKDALDDFLHARIQTLDSYSASIVKQCAPRYGINPDFKIDEDRCRELAMEISYPFLVANRNHPAVKKLYSNNHPDAIVSGIFADILFKYTRMDIRLDFLSDVKTQFDLLCLEWENHCGNIKKLFDEIVIFTAQDSKYFPAVIPVIEKYSNSEMKIPKTAEIRKYLNILLDTPADTAIEKAESSPVQEDIIDFIYYLKSIRKLDLRSGKRSDNPVKENIKIINKLYEGPVFSLAISCMQAGFNISIMNLLMKLKDAYLAGKRSEGILTFTDTANLSRTILIEQKDIRQNEKETFKAVMIDEFQDNNELQKDILFLLSEKKEIQNDGVPPACDLCPDKLFFVGDEKQSIYFFRGADVSVFRRLKNEIKSEDLPLKINYRSSPDLIGAFNSIFGGSAFDPYGKNPLHEFPSVFAPPDSLPPYEAGYNALESGCGNQGVLTINILNKKSESSEGENTEENDNDFRLSAYENEARFTAEKINELLSSKYKPDDIAILLRDTAAQHLFEKHLRSLNIPYACEKINNLFFAGPVNDIISVLRLVSHPMDKAAYAEMLRSPFARLSLSGTALCLSAGNDTEPFNDNPLALLDTEDAEKYLFGRDIYLSIVESSSKKNTSGLISELWHERGYRYETEWNHHTSAYREMFDYLFHLAAKADSENQGLASFTDSMIALRDAGGQLSSDTAIPLERQGAVQLMTIHKAKGLEFPVVFMCCCGKKSRSDSCGIVYKSDNAGLVFSPPVPLKLRQISSKRNNFFWEAASREIKQKRTAELRRLLYVGMTRAGNELHITGSLEIKSNEEINDFSLLLKNYINEKQEKSEKYIDGDSIWNNDTLFGILLPPIVSHIPDTGFKKGCSFFNLEEIPVYTEEYLKRQALNNTGPANDQKNLNDYIDKNISIYKNACPINTPIIWDNHITPVSIKETHGETSHSKHDQSNKNYNISGQFSGENSDDIFKAVDSMLEKFIQKDDKDTQKFHWGNFGTIAHSCVEALLNGTEAVIPSNISGLLSPSELTSLTEAGNELAKRFIASPLGKITQSSRLRESEFQFRTIIKKSGEKEIFINGTIDLFIEEENTIHIVDFKTDSREIPNEHTAQLSCYLNALRGLFKEKKCRAWLYYLRTGHAVEMTQEAEEFDLEKTALSNFNC